MADSKPASQAPADLDDEGRDIQPADDPDDRHLQAARRAWERNAQIAPGRIGQRIYRILSLIALIIAAICVYAVGVMLWRTFF